VHGLGRLGISNAIWDKPTALGAGEWERVRLHPYLTERMLQQSRSLAPLGAIAVQLRERLDGSGYPRGLSGTAISQPARVLGAADAYQAMREPRPYRPPLSADLAASELRAEVRRGGWTQRRWTQCWPRPAIAFPAAAAARPVSPRARSRCCGCWRAASPTSRSPPGW
jgi:HD-GYP domain-containing protein (c-di-GMP phosphodiesterase class II)